jgi:ribonuclease T2
MRRASPCTPLVLHGLWPENRQPETYPRDCRGGRLELDATSMRELSRWMPGVSEGLHIHEWRKHGRCTGLSGSDYYRSAIHYTEQANAALGPSILRYAGRADTAATLRAEANADPSAFWSEHRVCVQESAQPRSCHAGSHLPHRGAGLSR